MSTPEPQDLDLDDNPELIDAFGLPVSTDVEDIRDELHDRMAEQLPGWVALPTGPDTAILGALATVTAETRDALQERLRTELLSLIGSLFGLPRLDGLSAMAQVTLTAGDTLGHVAPAPLTVWLGDVELETLSDLLIPAGETVGTVDVQTVEPGSEANGADDTDVGLEVDALDWLAETDPVTLSGPLTGGTDPEGDDTYSSRLVSELQIMAPAPILPQSFAVLARRNPTVGFAWCLPTYDPDTETEDAPLHVTVVIADQSAQAVPAQVLEAVQTDLQARLLTNVIVHVIGPTYVPVNVTTSVVCRPGWDPPTVQAAVTEHLASVLDPAGWAAPQYGDDPNPIPGRVIHVNELIARCDDVDGVDWVETLTLNDGTSDRVTLGHLELPEAGTITVTASPA